MESWEEEGRRLAPRLQQCASFVVLGTNPQCAAAVAVGIAKAESLRRHVAIGDLVGDLAPLYALAGGEDADGLSDCLRDDRPLNEVARPAPECAALFVLPAGTPPVATEFVFGHERWPKLVKGFAQAGALLLLVAPAGAPGLDTLIAATDGVVAVDIPPARVRQYTVLATVDAPEQTPGPRAMPRRARRLIAAACVVPLIGAGVWFLMHRASPDAQAPLTEPVARHIAAPLTAAQSAPPLGLPAPADTVRLGAVVNPADSARAAGFAVEVVAANTFAGANSVLRSDAELSPLPAPTISPVQLSGGALWYKAVVGAWNERDGADSLLTALRKSRLVRGENGLVVRVPYALLLADTIAPEAVIREVDVWRGRGIAAYALMQEDGSIRLYAGAFETPAQAAPLAASVRDAGRAPALAFRTGRMY